MVEPFRIDFAPGEDQRTSELLVQQREQRGTLVLRFHDVEPMADAHRGAGRRDVDTHRIAHEFTGDHLDRIGHRRGEHHRLTGAGQAAQHVADLRQKSEVEHVVRFVEDQLFDRLE